MGTACRLAACGALCCLAISAGAEGFLGGAGTTGAQFLELPVGARASAMGSAQAAAVDDATALYYNPGALGGLRGGSAVFMHAAQFQSMSYEYLAAAHPVPGIGTLGLGIQYFGAGSIEEVNNTGQSTGGRLTPTDIALTLGYGTVFRGFEPGLGLKFISSKLQNSAQTFAVDTGIRFRRGDLGLAASIANLGPGLKFRDSASDLPLTFRLGSSLDIERWVLACDAVAARGAEPSLGLGAEYGAQVSSRLKAAGRLGFNTRPLVNNLGAIAAFSFGGGMTMGPYQIDYALVPVGELGITHRISASVRWGSYGNDRPH